MIRYFSRPPYSQQPVGWAHVALIIGLLSLSAASFYFLGGLLTARLMLLVMMLTALALVSFTVYRTARAVRDRQIVTLYGPVALADRPAAFAGVCIALILTPIAMLALLLLLQAQDPRIQLLPWLSTIWERTWRVL